MPNAEREWTSCRAEQGGGPSGCRVGAKTCKRRSKRPRQGVCSPRTWRWSVPVFPDFPGGARALHARGGGPLASRSSKSASGCSPRMWRWSVPVVGEVAQLTVLSTYVEVIRAGAGRERELDVFSTYVEVVRNSSRVRASPGRALYARGGGPRSVFWFEAWTSALHTCGGDPGIGRAWARPDGVLSTQVSVPPSQQWRAVSRSGRWL